MREEDKIRMFSQVELDIIRLHGAKLTIEEISETLHISEEDIIETLLVIRRKLRDAK